MGGVMSNTCPCCGQSIADSTLRVSLEFNVVIHGSTALDVTPKECEIIHVLQAAWPNTLPTERLVSRVWGRSSNVNEESMRNLVYNARRKLNTIDFTIRAVRNRGYRLERLGHMSR